MKSLKEQEIKVREEMAKLEKMGGEMPNRIVKLRDSTFAKFPIFFIFLSSFGLVATFYGFEKVIDQIDYFTDKPYMVLVTGLLTLFLTGALYKKLS